MKKKLSVLIFLTCIGMFFLREGIAQNIPQRLYVFDRSLSDYIALSTAKSADGQVLILPERGNPLEQIKVALSAKQYNEVHIYTNVKNGSVVFNSLALTSNELQVQKLLLSEFKNLVSGSCHIIIYGDPGTEWLNLLETLTGIVVVSE